MTADVALHSMLTKSFSIGAVESSPCERVMQWLTKVYGTHRCNRTLIEETSDPVEEEQLCEKGEIKYATNMCSIPLTRSLH